MRDPPSMSRHLRSTRRSAWLLRIFLVAIIVLAICRWLVCLPFNGAFQGVRVHDCVFRSSSRLLAVQIESRLAKDSRQFHSCGINNQLGTDDVIRVFSRETIRDDWVMDDVDDVLSFGY